MLFWKLNICSNVKCPIFMKVSTHRRYYESKAGTNKQFFHDARKWEKIIKCTFAWLYLCPFSKKKRKKCTFASRISRRSKGSNCYPLFLIIPQISGTEINRIAFASRSARVICSKPAMFWIYCVYAS